MTLPDGPPRSRASQLARPATRCPTTSRLHPLGSGSQLAAPGTRGQSEGGRAARSGRPAPQRGSRGAPRQKN
eukprot:7470195-Pyramimonas_sp.AAC.1